MTTKAKRRAERRLTAQPDAIREAIYHLKAARNSLRWAGSKNAADYVARALKSAEGALRHAERMARNHVHIGVGYCPTCKHYGQDCIGTKGPSHV